MHITSDGFHRKSDPETSHINNWPSEIMAKPEKWIVAMYDYNPFKHSE